jgi:hydroxyacyl-ACP dehydratase HTD2-like protein with hotdog domain
MPERAAVGLVIDEVDFRVEEGKVREFALAVGQADHGDVPLTFVTVSGHWRDQAAMVAKLGLDIRRIVVGGAEWEYHAPLRVGDRVRGARVLVAVDEKPRGDGTMKLLTLETRFHRGDGALAVIQRDTVIELPT